MTSCVDRHLKISVVIATYNRSADLKVALASILRQTVPPLEMIIVDDSTNEEVRTAVESLQGAFSEKGVALVYLHNPGKRSLPVSRNYGAKHAMGDIVMFLDDDVVLEPGYNEGILEVYALGTHVKGVTGFRTDNPKLTLGFKITNAFDRAFFIFGYTTDRCELLPSWYAIYPHTLTKVISCEWFSGCNQSYLRSVLSELQFDEKLMRYAPGGEDLDFSFRVHRKYPGSLFITPKARFLHHYSPAARTPPQSLFLLEAAYRQYLWAKNMEHTRRNTCLFVWGMVGRMVASLMVRTKAQLTGKSKEPALDEFQRLLKADVMCWRHRKEIERGELGFLDRYLEY
jgi:glycosyltransferase involved in cell wall biosynthesis